SPMLSDVAGRLGLNNERLDRMDRRQVLRDASPAVALIGACIQRAGIGAKVNAGPLKAVSGHGLPQHTEKRVGLRQAFAQVLPRVAAVACPPDCGLRVGYEASCNVAVERQEIE